MKIIVILISFLFGYKSSLSQEFTPYPENYKRLVQSVSFSLDDSIMYFTLPNREYLSSRNSNITNKSPRLALYQAKKNTMGNWSEPELLTISGEFDDYEPSLSPDGMYLFFNSKRPLKGNVPVNKNNIWYSKKVGDSWSTPQYMKYLNNPDLEESYATISKDYKLVYVSERNINNKNEYAVYETYFEGISTKAGEKIEIIDIPKGSGDPLISPNGSFLIYTKYDPENWALSCDLFFSYKTESGWSSPIELTELNSDGPDFGAAISADNQWLFYRKNYQFIKIALQPILRKYHPSYPSLKNPSSNMN